MKDRLKELEKVNQLSLTEEEIALNLRNAESYVKEARQMREDE